jgi:hypothetical protein
MGMVGSAGWGKAVIDPGIFFGLWPSPECQPTISLGPLGSAAAWNPAGDVEVLQYLDRLTSPGVALTGSYEADATGLCRYDLGTESFLAMMFVRYPDTGLFHPTGGYPVVQVRNLTEGSWAPEIELTSRTARALMRTYYASSTLQPDVFFRPARRQGHLFFMPIGPNDGLLVANAPSVDPDGRGFTVWRHLDPDTQAWVPFVADTILDQADTPIVRGSSLSVADQAVLEGYWCCYQRDEDALNHNDRGRVHLHRVAPNLTVTTRSIHLRELIESSAGANLYQLHACGILDVWPQGEDGYKLSIPSTRWPHTGSDLSPEFWLQASGSTGDTDSRQQLLATIAINSRTAAAKVKNLLRPSLDPVLANPTVVSDNRYAAGETGDYAFSELGPFRILGYLQFYSDLGACLPRDGSHPEIPDIYYADLGRYIRYFEPFPVLPDAFGPTIGPSRVTIWEGKTRFTGLVRPAEVMLSSPIIPFPRPVQLESQSGTALVSDNQGPNRGLCPAGIFSGGHYGIAAEPYPLVVGLTAVAEPQESEVLETQPVHIVAENGTCETFEFTDPNFPVKVGRKNVTSQRLRYEERYATYLRLLASGGTQGFKVRVGKLLNLSAEVSSSGVREESVEVILNWFEWGVRGPYLWVLHTWPRGLDETAQDIADAEELAAYLGLIEPHLSRYNKATGTLVDRVSLRPASDAEAELTPSPIKPHMILGTNADGHHATVWSEWVNGPYFAETRHNAISRCSGSPLTALDDTSTATTDRPTILESLVSVVADGKLYFFDDLNKLNAIEL